MVFRRTTPPEALAGVLRPGNAGSNTAVDHITVTDAALAQIPDGQRYGQPILFRADGAGASRKWLWHLTELGTQPGVDLDYSVGFTMTSAVREAIGLLPEAVWTPAWDADGDPVEFADVAELTGILPHLAGNGWPPGMRVLVRRERPHPGAQLNLFEEANGWRYRCFVTNTPSGQLGWLEARHRAHARVEDRIRYGKDLGLGRLPYRQFNINCVWLELALAAADLIAWTQTILLTGEPGESRTQNAALPPPTRRRTPHARTTPHPAAVPSHMALATSDSRRVPHPGRTPTTDAHLAQNLNPYPPATRTPGDADTTPPPPACPHAQPHRRRPKNWITPELNNLHEGPRLAGHRRAEHPITLIFEEPVMPQFRPKPLSQCWQQPRAQGPFTRLNPPTLRWLRRCRVRRCSWSRSQSPPTRNQPGRVCRRNF